MAIAIIVSIFVIFCVLALVIYFAWPEEKAAIEPKIKYKIDDEEPIGKQFVKAGKDKEQKEVLKIAEMDELF